MTDDEIASALYDHRVAIVGLVKKVKELDAAVESLLNMQMHVNASMEQVLHALEMLGTLLEIEGLVDDDGEIQWN
jgi:rRNA processing protein Krr1/Pno1